MKRIGSGLGAVVLLLLCATSVEASRVYRPMGDYVREAALIVVGDTRKGGDKGYDTVLSVKEVIKGDGKATGLEIVLGIRMSTADVHIPTPATKIAVLLRKGAPDRDGQIQEGWTPLEVYTTPKDVAAVRTLVEIYRRPEERQQLLGLRQKALAGNERCLTQLLADLASMREPANFDVMTELYDALAPTNQAKLVEIMGRMSDPRAVPPLIKAMRSPDAKVSSTAAHQLIWHFPGAPGVTEAFEEALKRKHLAREAARYLAKRRDDPALEELKGQDTPWVRAERLWNIGKKEEARAAFLAIVTAPNATPYASRHAALKLLPKASPAEKETIRKACIKQLTADAREGNYLEMGDAAQILRVLRHPDCLGALLAILPRTDFLYWHAARTATLGIRELGAEARQKGVSQLLENLGPSAPNIQQVDARIVYLLEIIWLGDKESYSKAAEIMPEAWRASWQALHPLTAIAGEEDEGAFLLHMLNRSHELPMRAQEWVLFRLGDLKEQRGVKMLREVLSRESHWGLTEAAKEALIRISGAEVEREMLALVTHESQSVRAAAIDVLFRIQGERSRDLARRMLLESNYGLKQSAMLHLASVGTPEDLAFLLPYCDYWKADRTTHYWAVQAVSSIRERYHYDVNGPIVKASIK